MVVHRNTPMFCGKPIGCVVKNRYARKTYMVHRPGPSPFNILSLEKMEKNERLVCPHYSFFSFFRSTPAAASQTGAVYPIGFPHRPVYSAKPTYVSVKHRCVSVHPRSFPRRARHSAVSEAHPFREQIFTKKLAQSAPAPLDRQQTVRCD